MWLSILPISFNLASFCLLVSWLVGLGLHPQHMEISKLGVELEPQLLAYTTATAM